jgi:hypothetical protein
MYNDSNTRVQAPPGPQSALNSSKIGHATQFYHRGWPLFLLSISIWYSTTLLWKYWWKAPVCTHETKTAKSIYANQLWQTNVYIAAYPTPLGRWLTALRMVFDSEKLLQSAYSSVWTMKLACT